MEFSISQLFEGKIEVVRHEARPLWSVLHKGIKGVYENGGEKRFLWLHAVTIEVDVETPQDSSTSELVRSFLIKEGPQVH